MIGRPMPKIEVTKESLRLEALPINARQLLSETRRKTSEIDRLWAARKEVSDNGRRCTETGNALARPDGWELHEDGDLKLEESHPFECPSSAPERSPNESLFVVVEDEVDDFALLKRAFAKAEVAIPLRWVKSGAEAMKLVSNLPSSVRKVCLVLETRLQDMNSVELVRALRLRSPDKRFKFVLLTGRLEPSIRAEADAWGVDAFFLKPVRSAELVEVARSLQRVLES